MEDLIKNLVSQYSVGYEVVDHKNAKIKTTFGSNKADELNEKYEDLFTYTVGFVPLGYEHRPDLISNLFYETPDKWWLLMKVNNISDPFEGFNVGDKILIPKL
jgi:hypothetical protein